MKQLSILLVLSLSLLVACNDASTPRPNITRTSTELIMFTATPTSTNMPTQTPQSTKAPTSANLVTSTAPPTSTNMPTLTSTNTPTSTQTPRSTNTPIPIPPTATSTFTPTPMPLAPLVLIRPVPASVALYHIYGSNPDYEGFHPGYDYGFLDCNPIEDPIVAMAAGKILYTWVDADLRPGQKDGGIRIDFGVHKLADGRTMRVIGQYGHIVPTVTSGQVVQEGTQIANFSTCERYGYYPELEIQIFALDYEATRGMTSDELYGYLVDLMNAGETPHIDPILVAIPPQ